MKKKKKVYDFMVEPQYFYPSYSFSRSLTPFPSRRLDFRDPQQFNSRNQ
jgi:hypothetical protein